MVVEAVSVDPPEPEGGELCPAASPATAEQPSLGPGQWTAMTAASKVASGSSSAEASRSSSLQELAGCSTPNIIEAASVRQKAQYFEALIRTNTDTLIRCASSEVAGRNHSTDMELGSEDGGSDTEHWQGDYSEVQLVLRVPKSQPQRAVQAAPVVHPQYGSVDDMAELIERLQEQLQVKDRERQLTSNALARKNQECENLMRLVRELADSRAKAVSAKCSLQEKYAELQTEFHRTLRIAELSRTVSKENLAKTSRTQKALRQTEDELHSTKKQAVIFQNKSKKLKTEVSQLKEKLSLLERLDVFEGVQQSACMREFTRYRVCETY